MSLFKKKLKIGRIVAAIVYRPNSSDFEFKKAQLWR